MKTRARTLIRYGDQGSHAWILKEAPCSWRGNIDVEFFELPFGRLEPAGSGTHPAIVSRWLRTMRSGRMVPPLIVCATERSTFYIRDGNHRYHAMCELFTDDPDTQVRVAQVVPKAGYHFRYRWFGTYGTYVLEPVSLATRTCTRRRTDSAGPHSPLRPPSALVAHPEDQTGDCAALLQRLLDPVAGIPSKAERAAIGTFDRCPGVSDILQHAAAGSPQ